MEEKWETAPHVACRDSTQWLRNHIVAWFLAFIVPGGGTMLATLFIPPNADLKVATLYGFLGGIAGLFLLFMAVYISNLFRAPIKQRNEARKQLMVLKNRLAEAGYVEALTWDCIELSNKLKSFTIINNHDRSQFHKWSTDVLNYLDSKNRHQESLQWLRNVSINNIQSLGYEDVLRAYDAGYNILLELHKKLTD